MGSTPTASTIFFLHPDPELVEGEGNPIPFQNPKDYLVSAFIWLRIKGYAVAICDWRFMKNHNSQIINLIRGSPITRLPDHARSPDLSILVLIFFRHIVLGELPGPYFALVGIAGILHAADCLGFHVLPFFHQLFHALRIVICPA